MIFTGRGGLIWEKPISFAVPEQPRKALQLRSAIFSWLCGFFSRVGEHLGDRARTNALSLYFKINDTSDYLMVELKSLCRRV